jgi:hypothetical protein
MKRCIPAVLLGAALTCAAQTPAPATTQADKTASDGRDNFEANAYTGVVIDNFAAQESNALVYPGNSQGVKSSYVVGIDFAYRLYGDKTNDHAFKGSQFWIYGETIHGQRSTDVDCTQPTKPDACALLSGSVPANLQNQFYSVLRNATSLEAYVGLRWEFLTLQAKSMDSVAKLYAKSELGFMAVSGAGAVIDNHQKIALGAMATNGKFAHSYLEAGWGKDDVFRTHRGRRFKVDGFLSWDLNHWMTQGGVTPFIEMVADTDFGPGSDSVRTYFGFNFDLGKLWSPVAK